MVKKKVKILDATYNKDLNLIKLLVRDLKNNKEITLVLRGTELGIPNNVPIEIIDNFRKDIIGKEKNITIEMEGEILNSQQLKDMTAEEFQKKDEIFNRYPVNEIIKEQTKIQSQLPPSKGFQRNN